MRFSVARAVVEVIRGDITKQDTEAVVNAANRRLAPGGGVAGAIHRAAGPELWEECKQLGGCETGEAKITKGYRLPAKYVIHTVGPVYSGSPQDARLLASCYQNSLRLCADHHIRSVSFPAISTGAFGYPLREAARVAARAVVDHLRQHPGPPELVRFVLFGEDAYQAFLTAFKQLGLSPAGNSGG